MTGVELVGAPGSGKSALAGWLAGRAVIDAPGRARRRIVPAGLLLATPRGPLRLVEQMLRHRETLALCARHPRLGARLLDASSDPLTDWDGDWGLGARWEQVRRAVLALPVDGPRGEAAYREAAAGWLEITARLVEASRTPPIGVIPLVDEGLVQRSRSILGGSAPSSGHPLLLGMIPSGVLVVHLSVADELLVRRAMRRLDTGREPELHRGRDRAEVARLVLEDAVALARRVDEVADRGVRVLHLVVDGDEHEAPSPASLGLQVIGALRDGITAT